MAWPDVVLGEGWHKRQIEDDSHGIRQCWRPYLSGVPGGYVCRLGQLLELAQLIRIQLIVIFRGRLALP